MSLRLVLIAVLLVVAGCGQGAVAGTAAPARSGMPGDLVGEISYANGSVAPPYHYEWRVRFDTEAAHLTWSPGYEDTEEWTETVELGADARTKLYDRLDQAGLFEFTEDTDDGLVGGPTGRATFDGLYDGTLGASEAGQDLLDEVVAATKAVFPDEVWAGMEQRQRDWEARQPK
jgi:hypothetical protein